MRYEKSCGAIIFRNSDAGREYLLILNRKNNAKGHWGFPKGHTEPGENEYITAAREIYEETGLRVVFCQDARVVTTYNPRPDIEKDAVYFLATPRNDQRVKLQQEEVAEFRWCSAAEAKSLLTFDGKIIDKIERFF